MKKLGFTLVELLVVMVIILILAGIGIKNYNSVKMRAKNVQVKANLHSIQVALEEYGVDHSNYYPGLNWEMQSGGRLTNVEPAILGGVEFNQGDRDYQSWYDSPIAHYPDQTPMVNRIDVLIENQYLTKYPANPFLSTGSAAKSQMTNVFRYVPTVRTYPFSGQFAFGTEASVDWNRLTTRPAQTMKINYDDDGRGHFSYIPLNPVNNQGWDFLNDWSNLTDPAKTQFYKYCRSYVLIGWGYSREDTTVSKGFSGKYYFVDNTDPNNPVEGYDLDHNLRIDDFEANLITASRPEQADSGGVIPTNFGAMVGGNAFRDMDDALAGATLILTP